MNSRRQYYMIEADFLPPSIIKVQEAKALLERGEVKTISEATARVGISRSVFYKYQDAVKPIFKNEAKRSVTLGLNLQDETGVLSDVLHVLASFSVNLLTINQTIPLNGIANVTLTFETLDTTHDLEALIEALNTHQKILSVTILGRELL